MNLRITRTIGATDVTALSASLATASKQGVALVAVPANPLARLPVHQVLASGLRRLGQLELGLLLIDAPVRHNDGVGSGFLRLRSPALTAGLLLLLGTLGRIASALLATDMRATGALLGHAERGVALMAGTPDAHANRLFGTEGSPLSRPPLTGVDLEPELLAELLGTLLIELAPRDSNDAFGKLGLFLGDITNSS